ncbi:MAG: MFS transporter [Geminicoccaceae bacterium]
MLLSLDIVVLQLALPAMGAELALGPAALQALNACYLAAFAGSLLPAGGLIDRVGPVRMFAAGTGLLVAGSVVGGLAASLAAISVARVVQGIGGGLLLPSALALLGSSFAEGQQRDRATGLWTISAVVGVVAGILLGGLATELAGWRATFWLGAALALPLLAGPLLVFAPAPRIAAAPFDATGVILSVTAFAALTAGLALVGATAGAAPWLVVLAGAGLLAVFLRHLSRTAAPLVRLDSLRQRAVAAPMLAGLVHGIGPQGLLFVLSLHLQSVRGWRPAEVGIALLPAALLAPAGALAAVRLMRRLGTRLPLAAGLALMGLAFAASLGIDATSGYAGRILPSLALMGIGATLASVPMYAGVLSACPPGELGSRSSLLNAGQYLGPAVGLTLMTLVAGDGGLGPALATGASIMLLAAAIVGVLHPGRPAMPVAQGAGWPDASPHKTRSGL